MCSLEVPLRDGRVARSRSRAVTGVTTLVNPAPLPDGGIDFLALADYVTPNEGEAARLAGAAIADLDAAAHGRGRASARGARGTAVLTLGAGGALADGPGGVVHVPAFAVTAVDTTGAGDAFNGALAVALG